VQTPALRAVGNIVTGDDQQTQVVLQSGALQSLPKLLAHTKKAIRKETCWIISNIAAGSQEQIQALVDTGIFPSVISLLQTADFDIKKEAAWAISNVTSTGSPQQIEHLIQLGCIKPMVDLLHVNDAKVVSVALESIEDILKMGKMRQVEQCMPENICCSLIEQVDGLSKIEALQENTNQEVYQRAVQILEKFFDLEDGSADIVDDHSGGQQHVQFGAQIPQSGFSFGRSLVGA
jgi:hypothetical protein